jgi:GT2 family glycosyltransferase
MPNNISVVIPNYNGIDLLENNLRSLHIALQRANTDYEIIVVDDASTDKSVDFIRTNYPDIKLIINQTNRGFSITMNRGIFAAKNELILSLNTDVLLNEDYFLPLFRYFEAHDTFAVSGKIIGLTDDKPQDIAKYPNCSLSNISGTTNYKITGYKPGINSFGAPSFFTSGANTLYNREKLSFIGGFTELYSPYYGEDLDLSIKAWRLGWKSYYEENAVCRHPASTTIKKYNRPKKIRIITKRNKLTMHFSHLKGMGLVAFAIKTLGKLLFIWIKLDFTYYQSFIKFIHLVPEVVRYRKSLKNKARGLNKNLKSLHTIVTEIKREIRSSSYYEIV